MSKEKMSIHQSVSTLWMNDLGVDKADFSINNNGDVTYKGRTFTRAQMIAGNFGTSKEALADFVATVSNS